MEKLILRPEAAASEGERAFPFREILFFAVPLASLMTSGMETSPLCFLVSMAAAFLLAVMTEEDAHEQTIDIRLLALLGAALLFVAFFQDRALDFAHSLVAGIVFFGLLRLALSFWLTWRLESSLDSAALEHCSVDDEATAETRMGYVPIFMLVFVLYLGFGSEWAPIVFQNATVMVSIAGELMDMFPELWAFAIGCWLLLTGWEIFRAYKNKPIVSAFGGGDVLFLGVFAGHLGGGPLMALFFLSLVAQAFLIGIRGDFKTISFL